MYAVVDVEFRPNWNLISSATKSEPSDKATSYKAISVKYSVMSKKWLSHPTTGSSFHW